jgi:steroid 5-alpha reductase family enzyme
LTFPHLAIETAAVIGVSVFVLWLVSLPLRNASIADVFWPLGFVLVAIVSSRADGYAPRKIVVGALVTIWGLRLAIHLYLRNRGGGEDPRYRAMRRRWGESRFPMVSLFTVFGFQGVLLWIVSLPIQVAMLHREPNHLTWVDAVGTTLLLVGFAFETIADLQLTRFKSDPANDGKVMDRGLWRYTRHPNYFGDALVWWGLGVIGLGTSGAPYTAAIVGPGVMTFLLVRVSGVPLLERRMKRTRPAYAEYVARTSSFFPMRPKEKQKT